MRRDTEYFSVFSPNAGKCGPEVTPFLDTFHAVVLLMSVKNQKSAINNKERAIEQIVVLDPI